jgi:branched-chain amino acid transport system substrate-binding protein
VFEPQTGDNGGGGKKEILGMQYANYVQPTVDIAGETYDVQLEIVDNRTTPENGPSAASELVNRGVSVILGSYGSGVSAAGGTVFSEAGIPAIGVTCTNPQVTSDCDVYFRICFLDPFQGTVLANYAFNELGVTTAYTLAMLGSDYDQGLVYYFTQAFEALGGTVVSEDFPEGSANFVSYINNAKSANAGVIFAPVSINYAQLIVEASDAQGYTGALLGSDTWDDNKVIESATGKNVNAYVTTFYQEGGAPEFDAGIKEWINANADAKTNNGGNDMISAVTVMGYDAYFTALEAIKSAGSTDPAAVLAALPGVSYTGVSGLIEFDEIGDAVRDSAFIKTANTQTGAWDFVKVQTVD